MTVLQPQRLETQENQPKSSQVHTPTFWSLLYIPEGPSTQYSRTQVQNKNSGYEPLGQTHFFWGQASSARRCRGARPATLRSSREYAWRRHRTFQKASMRVLVKIMVHFWVLSSLSMIMIRHLLVPKGDHNFDNHPCTHVRSLQVPNL